MKCMYMSKVHAYFRQDEYGRGIRETLHPGREEAAPAIKRGQWLLPPNYNPWPISNNPKQPNYFIPTIHSPYFKRFTQTSRSNCQRVYRFPWNSLALLVLFSAKMTPTETPTVLKITWIGKYFSPLSRADSLNYLGSCPFPMKCAILQMYASFQVIPQVLLWS